MTVLRTAEFYEVPVAKVRSSVLLRFHAQIPGLFPVRSPRKVSPAVAALVEGAKLYNLKVVSIEQKV